MKRKLLILLLFSSVIVFGQVGIGTDEPDSSALLEINSLNKGFLPPRIDLTSTKDITTIENPATGLIIYEPDGFSETINGIVYNRPDGVYMFDGTEWVHLLASNDNNTPWEVRNQTGVKIDINQTDFLTLTGGDQSYGSLLENSGVTIAPSYVAGIWPPESNKPSDIITLEEGDLGALLKENPLPGQPNYFRINFEYKILGHRPSSTSYFTVKVLSVATGSIVFSDEITVTSGTNDGRTPPFQLFFPTLADTDSINAGYKIEFNVDTSSSSGLANNIGIKMNHIVRIN